jgi:hypothetical protein
MQVFSDVFLDDRVPLALIVLTAEANHNIRAMNQARGLEPKRLTTEDIKGVVKALEDLGYLLMLRGKFR